MANIDKQFKELYRKILDEGYLRAPDNQFYSDGTPALRKSIVGGTIRLEPKDGLGFVTSKKLPPKSLTAEVLGFYQSYTSDIKELQKLGTHVWDEWAERGMGKSYGYQIGNQKYEVGIENVSHETLHVLFEEQGILSHTITLNQMENVIHQIIDKPESTRIITDIWTVEDLPDMALPPCVFFTQWVVTGDTLNLVVKSRSSDAFLGLPFNVAQFHVLQHLIAHITNKRVGVFEFQMSDVHLYDRHFEAAQQFIDNPEYPSPTLWIKDEVKSWGKFSYGDNFKILDYVYEPYIPAELTVNTEELKEKGIIDKF